jgi:diguanylate cyclase (GGDEF)-like protein/PAS domain S-box-containing protein
MSNMVRWGWRRERFRILALAAAVTVLAARAAYQASWEISRHAPLEGLVVQNLTAVSLVAAILVALVSLGVLKREHARRRRSEIRMARLAQGVDQGDMLVTIVNRKGRIEYVNRTVESATGFSSAELLAPRSGRWFPWYAEDRSFEEVRDALVAGRAYRGMVSCLRKDGTPFLLEEHVTPMQEGKERTARFVSTSRDVTRQKQVEERLFQLDRFDPLTGVPHRRHFLELVQNELAQRGGEDLAVLVMDVERFKYINDIFSPEVGDEMLRHVARVLRELVGAHGTVGRLGSDEFAVLHRSSAAEARTLAERILGALARETHIASHNIAVTVSIGVALAAQDFSDAGTLLKNADTALSFAQEFGRNSVRFFTRELSERAFRDYEIQRRFAEGFRNGEYGVHYQPYCDLASGRISGAEALIRWESGELGAVSPASFIPELEKSGLILSVGEWVLRTACQQIREWGRSNSRLPIAVNLSPIQFGHRDLVGLVADAVREHEIDPHQLTLELTESICTHDVDFAADLLTKLKGVGVSISIDDFGTGYSSLSYVKKLPVDNLKIDMSFVRDVTRDPDAASIITAITSMSRGLGLKTIAEGVESEEQRKILHLLRCDLGQGYHFGPAVAADVLEKRLGESAPS